jgi:hypothetical protein
MTRNVRAVLANSAAFKIELVRITRPPEKSGLPSQTGRPNRTHYRARRNRGRLTERKSQSLVARIPRAASRKKMSMITPLPVIEAG